MQPIPKGQDNTVDHLTHAQIEREARESMPRVRKALQEIVDRQSRHRKCDLKPELRKSDLRVDQLATSR